MSEQRRSQTEWMKEMETRLSRTKPSTAGRRANEPPSTPKQEEATRWMRPPRSTPEVPDRDRDRHLRVDQQMQRPTVRCFDCNKLGHLKRNCRSTPTGRPHRASVNFNSSGTPKGPSGGRSLYVRCTINQRRCMCLIDTGSETNLLPARLAEG